MNNAIVTIFMLEKSVKDFRVSFVCGLENVMTHEVKNNIFPTNPAIINY